MHLDKYIEVLQLLADPEVQLQYEQDVPNANVPGELVCMWFDDLNAAEPSCELEPNEASRIKAFTAFYRLRVDDLPIEYGLAALQASAKWKEVMAEARATLDDLGIEAAYKPMRTRGSTPPRLTDPTAGWLREAPMKYLARMQQLIERPAGSLISGIYVLCLATWWFTNDLLPEFPRWLYFTFAALLLVMSVGLIVDAVTRWRSPNKLRSTWYPFQSPEVREVCAHLSPEEHARLNEADRQIGRASGGSAGAVPVIAGVLFFMAWKLGLPPQPLIIIYSAIVGIYAVVYGYPYYRAIRQWKVKLLCEMEWARSQDYKPESFRLWAFPWSK